jgi:hypothetical protein
MSEVKKSSGFLILVAWVIVGVPAGWGVYKTAVNALNLFHAPAATTASAPAASTPSH